MLAELRKVSKFYQQPGLAECNRVLDEISLQIAENERIAITGPSGSGKSTLLNILGTLDKPTSGSVWLGGEEIDKLNENSLSALRNRFIGFVFQMHHLLPQLTVFDNVMLPLLPRKGNKMQESQTEFALQLIENVGMTGHLRKRPSQLSVGECQRVAVVRALISRPRLLLADEPTGSLDAARAADLMDLLTTLNRELQVALVVVTHAPNLTTGMDKIYRLEGGKLINC
jgi:ABC-type lipoprotein export system ATPase subunit